MSVGMSPWHRQLAKEDGTCLLELTEGSGVFPVSLAPRAIGSPNGRGIGSIELVLHGHGYPMEGASISPLEDLAFGYTGIRQGLICQ